jgi:hypothetical protein
MKKSTRGLDHEVMTSIEERIKFQYRTSMESTRVLEDFSWHILPPFYEKKIIIKKFFVTVSPLDFFYSDKYINKISPVLLCEQPSTHGPH